MLEVVVPYISPGNHVMTTMKNSNDPKLSTLAVNKMGFNNI